MKNSAFKSYCRGLVKSIPVFFGFLPVAITFAIMAGNAGMTGLETALMSVLVFAGASQIMSVEMLASGAGALSIIIATFVLNIRHVIMSACVFKKVRIDNFFLKMLGGMAVTDEGFAIITTEDDDKCDIPFVFGTATLIFSSWVVGTVVGILARSVLPEIVADSFGIALYALFIALIVPDIKKSLKLLLTVAITAIINIILCAFLDSGWAIIISTLGGAAIGTLITGDSNESKEAAV